MRLPIDAHLQPSGKINAIEKKECHAQQTKAYNDQKAHHLSELTVGSKVLIKYPATKRWSTPGVIVEVGRN